MYYDWTVTQSRSSDAPDVDCILLPFLLVQLRVAQGLPEDVEAGLRVQGQTEIEIIIGRTVKNYYFNCL